MVNWFRPGKDKKPPAPAPAQEPRVPAPEAGARAAPAPALPVLPQYPDYTQAPTRLSVKPPSFDGAFAPLAIVGIGAFGQAVVETLAAWLPPPAPGQPRAVTLRVIRAAGEALALGWGLSETQSNLTRGEYLELPYPRQDEREWSRRAGLDVFMQDIRSEPSQLWNMLQAILSRQPKTDFWVVASAFDPVGSGMIFDVAHLIHLVAKAQNKSPFIGWMLALPGTDWGYDEQPLAAAVLRDLTRLLQPNATRTVEYSPASQNRALHSHEARGQEDAKAVFLCEAPSDVNPQMAADHVIHRMALALLALTQAPVWTQYCGNRMPTAAADAAAIDAFGVHAYYAAMPEMQRLVRSRLARDILVNREWGVVRSVRRAQIEADETSARELLKNAGHDLLNAIEKAVFQGQRPRQWPGTINAELALASALRVQLQSLLDPGARGGHLLACYALLAGLDEILSRASLPEERLAPLQAIVAQAQKELDDWQKWLRSTLEATENSVYQASEQWQAAQTKPGYTGSLAEDVPESAYGQLSSTKSTCRTRLSDYVRWAWIRQDATLTLRLDILYPGFEPKSPSDWRFAPDRQRFPALWQQTLQVVTALTQETQDWQAGLNAVRTASDGGVSSVQLPALMLSYLVGDKDALLYKFTYQAGYDANWLNQQHFPESTGPARLPIQLPNWGFLLEIHHRIPLRSIECLPGLRRRYAAARSRAPTLHLFDLEQQAARIEETALSDRGLPRTQRPILETTWLSPKTLLTWQQKPDDVRDFVRAWLIGLVDPAAGRGPYRVFDDPLGNKTHEICQLTADHPLDALQQWGLRPENDQQKLKAAIRKAVQAQNDQRDERLTELERWDLSDTRNAEWLLLVHYSKQTPGS